MIRLGVYRHFRTKRLYRVLGIAKQSETLEDLVVYEPLYTGSPAKYWVRPLAMFEEMVSSEGIRQPRFSFVKNSL